MLKQPIDSNVISVSRLLILWHSWLDRNVYDLARQMRLSYVPPLMVYLAAGVSGLTAIVGTFSSRNTSICLPSFWLR